MSSAIVLGATGILGREIVKQLGRNPSQWKTVHALARSKKDAYPSNVVHHFVDLTTSADEMAKELQDVEGEYVFFAAYLQKDSEQANWDVNGDMLHNFLAALERTGAVSKIKRILLVTGCKQYGVHLGQPKNPMLETDPWVADPPEENSASGKFPPNFYYRQQAILKAFCQRHQSRGVNLSWTVTYPNDVIGFASGNFMNLASALGIYVAVSKELGQELVFPGSKTFYTRFDCFTCAKLHAQFCEWAVLEPKAANQAFNVVNGDVQSWQDLWPRVARRFGTKVKKDQFAGQSSLADEVDLSKKCPAPISLLAEEIGLAAKGDIQPSKLEQRVSLVKWSQQEEVKQAWEKLAEREELEKDAFEKATWAFLDFILGRNFDLVISMSKAREMGWTGYYDTWRALDDVFGELEEAKVLPESK